MVLQLFSAEKPAEVLFTHYHTILIKNFKKYLFQNYMVPSYLKYTGMSKTQYTCQVCMCYSKSHFRSWCNHMSRIHPLSKILFSINSFQRQNSVLRFHVYQAH